MGLNSVCLKSIVCMYGSLVNVLPCTARASSSSPSSSSSSSINLLVQAALIAAEDAHAILAKPRSHVRCRYRRAHGMNDCVHLHLCPCACLPVSRSNTRNAYCSTVSAKFAQKIKDSSGLIIVILMMMMMMLLLLLSLFCCSLWLWRAHD